MLNTDENNFKICLNCANIYELKKSNLLECPQCNYQISLQEYQLILLNAREAVLYGYHYRLQYEDQLKQKGKIDALPSISSNNEILNFMALAIISGATDDIVKIVIKKILSQLNSQLVKYSNSNVMEIKKLFDQENMAAFESDVSDFYYHLKEIEPEIRDAIVKEILEDIVSGDMASKLKISAILNKNNKPISEEEIEERLIKALEKFENQKRIEDSAVDFWKDIEK